MSTTQSSSAIMDIIRARHYRGITVAEIQLQLANVQGVTEVSVMNRAFSPASIQNYIEKQKEQGKVVRISSQEEVRYIAVN